MLLEYLIDNNNIDKTKEEISLIQNLILGEVNQSYENSKIIPTYSYTYLHLIIC